MRLRSVLTSLGLVFAVATTSVQAADLVGLITKVRIPYFNAMERGAQAAADKLGLELQIYSGKSHEDYEGQIAAIESLIAAGAKGFAIAPGSSTAIVPALQKARDAGLLVIVLDTPTDPINAADATYVTDNFEAGKLDGEWAKAHMGDKWATAKFALLDAFVVPNTTETLRDQGFMEGYGFDIKDPNIMGDEDADPRICGHFVTDANDEGGRTAMEQVLQKCPDLELVYTVNEPAFDGAYQALKAAGKDDGSIILVSIDGGCDAMKNMTDGLPLGATVMQTPGVGAAHAIELIANYIKTGEKPPVMAEPDYLESWLVANEPVAGLTSFDSKVGATKCWG